MKEIDLTGIVADHIDAINAGDTDLAVATFADDAYVNDNRRDSSESMRSAAGWPRRWSATR